MENVKRGQIYIEKDDANQTDYPVWLVTNIRKRDDILDKCLHVTICHIGDVFDGEYEMINDSFETEHHRLNEFEGHAPYWTDAHRAFNDVYIPLDSDIQINIPSFFKGLK